MVNPTLSIGGAFKTGTKSDKYCSLLAAMLNLYLWAVLKLSPAEE